MAAGGETSQGSASEAEANVHQLNLDFYRLEPASYFFFRLRNLLLSAGRGLELEQLMGKGVDVGTFHVSAPEGQELHALDEEQREAQHAFVTLETEVLLHHVGETLIRLYMAHEHSPACPWIAMSRERSPRRFKAKTKNLLERLDSPSGRDQMAAVFFNTTDRLAFGDKAPDEKVWGELLDSTKAWLSWFGTYILDGDVYNAAKHGLGVHPQRLSLSVEIDGKPFIGGSGPCLEYLQSSRTDDGDRQWRKTTKWVQWDRHFGCIFVAAQLIHRLWTVAQVQYGSAEKLDLELRVFATPSELFKNEEMALASFSHSLGFNADAFT
ncbi:MAG TPA: hypothetical protein VD761_10620 [Solirubrobacterales bacterium]|nr:hypothetical protein [Solirubrobacterales bacterium]